MAGGKPEDINFDPLALLVHLSGDEICDYTVFLEDLGEDVVIVAAQLLFDFLNARVFISAEIVSK